MSAGEGVERGDRARGAPRLGSWLLGAAGALLLLALANALAVHVVSGNSDSATVVLEGHAIASGNVALSGWDLSLDSFWSVDALFYAVGNLLFGLTPALIHLVPAALALLVLLVGLAIAGAGLDLRRRLVAALVLVLVLALSNFNLSFFLLQGPWHVGTALFSLCAFYLLRGATLDWRWLLAVVLLAAGLLGDLQMLGLGTLPVLLAGALLARRARSWRRGCTLAAAAPASVALALAVRFVAVRLGTFSIHEAHHTASLARVGDNFAHLVHWGVGLLGLVRGPWGGPAPSLVAVVGHTVVAAGLLGSLAFASWAALRGALSPSATERASVLDDLLLLAFLGDLGVFEVLTLSDNRAYARYLTAGLVFAAVLSARTLARHLPLFDRRALAALGCGALVAFVGVTTDVVAELERPVPLQPAAALERYLLAHRLTNGVGDYWAASIVTVDSGGRVAVRPVVANASSLIVRDGRQSEADWYAAAHFDFLVYQRAPYGRVSPATIARTFGPPSSVREIGTYYVARWNHPIVLPPGSFP